MSPEDLDALARVDLNLLRSFDALISERSVSLAARRLAVGQPAMSASLGRLRRLLDDPLLVREGSALVPTPVADALRGPVARALEGINGVLNGRRSFDPLVDERTFTVIASDHLILVMLKPLLQALRSEAPHVHLHVLPLVADVVGPVRRHQVDLAIAPRAVDDLPDEVRSRDILTDRLVCAVAADHPEVRAQVTREQFARYPHLVHDDGVTSTLLRRQLREQGVDESADVRTQSFVVSALMLEGTELVGILPAMLARSLAERARIRVVEPPVALPELTDTLYWSSRDDAEPAHVWLRERLALAATQASGRAAQEATASTMLS